MDVRHFRCKPLLFSRLVVSKFSCRACAYGIDPLVEKLVESGADPNAVNSFGYSCLLEGCHRGFADIVRTLLKSKVDLSYIPDPQVAGSSPFMSAPCQSALGESARCGFYKIVQVRIPNFSFFLFDCSLYVDDY